MGGRQAGAVPKQKQSCLLEESVFLLWNPTQTGGQSHLTRDRSGAFRGLARRATLGENGHLPERRPRGTGGSSRELVNGVNQGSALTPGCGASGRGSLRRLPWALVSSSVRWGINSTWVTGFYAKCLDQGLGARSEDLLHEQTVYLETEEREGTCWFLLQNNRMFII